MNNVPRSTSANDFPILQALTDASPMAIGRPRIVIGFTLSLPLVKSKSSTRCQKHYKLEIATVLLISVDAPGTHCPVGEIYP